MVEDRAARSVNDVKYLLESLRATVVRIRNVHTAFRIEIPKETDLPAWRSRLEGTQITQILTIHCEDVIESLEIIALYASCSDAAERHTAGLGCGLHPTIGGITDVPRARSRRIDLDAIGETPLDNEAAKDPFGERTPADISKTDK
jgi:hypothetical protein